MAFPTIPTTGNGRLLSQNQNNATSPRTFPSLSSLTKNAGDMLVAIVVAYERGGASATFSSWGASFTERTDIDGGATTMAVGIATKVSDGTETGTFTVAQASVVGHCSLFLLSIAGGGPLQMEVTALAVGTGAAADAAALDPANWGTEDTLWIAIAGNGETSTTGSWTGLAGGTAPTPPTNYGNSNSPGLGTDAIGGIHSAVAFRQNATGSENVGTWGGNDTTQARNCAMLLAIRPTLVKANSGILVVSGSGPEIWNHTPGVTYEDTGLGRMGVRGAPQVTGSGILVVSGSGVDAVTWADTGNGILARVASGVAVKTAGAVEKTGAGVVSELKGAASDAVTWTETGSSVLVRATSASDAVTFTETGSATLERVASASDAVTFVEAGTGILSRVGSGERESVGNTYEKTGLGRMGAEITGTTTETAGAGVAGLVASGADEATFIEAGSGVLNAVGSGVAVRQGSSEKTGAGIRGHVGAGTDAASFVETGSGIRGFVGSAADAVTFVEAGTGVLARIGSGDSEVGGGATYEKQAIGVMGLRLGGGAAGTGIRGFVGSGVAVEVTGALEKTGTGTRGLTASGSKAGVFNRTGKLARYEFPEPPSLDDDYPPSLTAVGSGVAVEIAGPATYTKTGSATRGMVGSGSDAVTFTETGTGILARTGGGTASREAGYQKSGTATSAHTASGADAVTFTKTVAGILDRSATGTDTAQFTKTGAGVFDRYASGEKIKLGEFVKFGSATAVFVASGAVETDLDRPPPGIITSTNTGRITRLRVGRITHSREGVLV